MARTITSIHFDLTFDASTHAPDAHVSFVERDASGAETEGRTTLRDDASRRVFGVGLLAAVNVEIDAQAAAVKEPGTVAARVSAAADAEARARRAAASLDDLNAQIATKAAELSTMGDAPAPAATAKAGAP